MRKRIAAAMLALCLLCTGAFADFADVPNDAWYAEAVSWAQANGIMDGVSEGSFAPDGAVTRAMLVTILYRLSGSPDMPESDWGYAYEDVDASAWYAAAVYWARMNGVADGVSDTQFDPDGNITREQLVTMLYRYAGASAIGGALSFYDAASVSSWAVEAVSWASAEGIVSGREGNLFDPQGGATRAECAAILMRYDAIQPEETPETPEVPEYTPDLESIPTNSYDEDEFYIDDEGYLRYGSDSLAGIDVSYHQGEIDWEAVADSGVDFAIIRIGYRGYSEGVIYQDPYFLDNIEGALDNGIEVGIYFFSQAVTVEEAVEEAEQTVEWLRGYSGDITFPVVFDWERISYSGSRTAELSAVTVTDCAIAFFDVIESAGYQPMAYVSPSTANEEISNDRQTDVAGALHLRLGDVVLPLLLRHVAVHVQRVRAGHRGQRGPERPDVNQTEVRAMKRLLPLILALACVLSLSACGGQPGGQAYFNATVLAVNEGSAELEYTDKLTSGISVGERFTISTDTASSDGAPELAVGDAVRVVFDGRIMESYPIQLGTIFAIYLLDENGGVMANE